MNKIPRLLFWIATITSCHIAFGSSYTQYNMGEIILKTPKFNAWSAEKRLFIRDFINTSYNKALSIKQINKSCEYLQKLSVDVALSALDHLILNRTEFIQKLFEIPLHRSMPNNRLITEQIHARFVSNRQQPLDIQAAIHYIKRHRSSTSWTPAILILLGPNNSGKTTLASAIASAFQFPFVEEIMRSKSTLGFENSALQFPIDLAYNCIMNNTASLMIGVTQDCFSQLENFICDSIESQLTVKALYNNYTKFQQLFSYVLPIQHIVLIIETDDITDIPQNIYNHAHIIYTGLQNEKTRINICKTKIISQKLQGLLPDVSVSISDECLDYIVLYPSDDCIQNTIENMNRIIDYILAHNSIDAWHINLAEYNHIINTYDLSYRFVFTDDLHLVPYSLYVNTIPNLDYVTNDVAVAGIPSLETRIMSILDVLISQGNISTFSQASVSIIPVSSNQALSNISTCGDLSLAISLYEILMNKKIHIPFACLGELDCKGYVLPIRDIASKIMIIKSKGISTILVPKENKQEVLQDNRVSSTDLIFVDHINEALAQLEL